MTAANGARLTSKNCTGHGKLRSQCGQRKYVAHCEWHFSQRGMSTTKDSSNCHRTICQSCAPVLKCDGRRGKKRPRPGEPQNFPSRTATSPRTVTTDGRPSISQPSKAL